MTKRRIGRPSNAVLRASFNISLTFKEQETLERIAFFLSIQREKHCTRNDSILYLINKHGAERIKLVEKKYAKYKKIQADKGEPASNRGFREWSIEEIKREKEADSGDSEEQPDNTPVENKDEEQQPAVDEVKEFPPAPRAVNEPRDSDE